MKVLIVGNGIVGGNMRKLFPAARVASGEAIIDIGSWMGSTTGLLMCGMLQSGNDVELHCYDQWIARRRIRLCIHRC